VFTSLAFTLLTLACLYALSITLGFAILGLLISLGWPFRKDIYADLSDLSRLHSFILGNAFFFVLLGLWLLLRYPFLLALFGLLALIGLSALFRFLRPADR
jgi:uncharacterized membrane protein YccF (DUF307 family)